MTDRVLGIIGGSGVYEIDGLKDGCWTAVPTPWGNPSDEILTGVLDGMALAFLPRHGRGHVHTPTSVPYRANIDALKRLGVTDLVSLSACGSFRDELKPGDFVLVDQFIDRTVLRPRSFFEEGFVAHVPFGHPVCSRLSGACATAADPHATTHRGGTYLAMEGPQFSTLAESRLYKDVWGCSVIGMTNMPEAKLAREAEICYATVAMVTDYDCWHPGHGDVEVAQIIATLQGNAAKARSLVAALPGLLRGPHVPCPQGCDRSLDCAIITAPDKRCRELAGKLDAVAGRVAGR